ncbi:MAG TPA: tetratricopeptide repeat protein [Abditibacteriaceae bacterium]|jgi:tetratricopeptide (TPR) repeat protein
MKTQVIQSDLRQVMRFNARSIIVPAAWFSFILVSGCSAISSNNGESADLSTPEVQSASQTLADRNGGPSPDITAHAAQTSSSPVSKPRLVATAAPGQQAVSTKSVVTGLPKVPTTPPKLSPALRKALAKPHYPVIAKEQTAQLKQAQTQSVQWAKRVLATAAKPVASGPGLVVCEPIAPSGETMLADFGAGAARWLHLVVAGRGEMGKTPLWHAVSDAGREMGRANLRFAPRDAARLAGKLGITHAATARITGNAARCTLKFQVWKVPSLQAVGAPLLLSGTQEQIVAQLPNASSKMCALLGASPSATLSATPAKVEVGAADLAFLGHVPWASQAIKPTSSLRRLETLAKRTPLAAVLWAFSGNVDQDESSRWRSVTDQAATQMPDNVIAVGAVGWQAVQYLDSRRKIFEQIQRKYPRNYVLAAAGRRWHARQQEYGLALLAAQRAIAAAPRNPLAWVALGSAFSDKASSIRNGRYYGRMSEEEQSEIARLYPQTLAANIQATVLDPQSETAWSALSESATFAGAPGIADLALWKTIRLAPNDTSNYSWGMQIYQPKWFDDRDRLWDTISVAAADRHRFINLTLHISSALEEVGLTTEAGQVMERSLYLLGQETKKSPKQPYAWEMLALILRERGHYLEAAKAYEQWLKIEPNNIIVLVNYANMCERQTQNYTRMKELYAQAMKVDPLDAVAPYNLGLYYKDVERNFDKAAPLFRKSMALDKRYTLPVTGLANIYWFLKGDGNTGEKLFLDAIRRNPEDGLAESEFAWALMRHDRREEAVKHAQRAIQLGESEHPVFKALGLEP